jgi:hypothetical protein
MMMGMAAWLGAGGAAWGAGSGVVSAPVNVTVNLAMKGAGGGEVLEAGSLAGIVRRADTLVIVKGVRVEECTRGWKEVTRSTYTDEDGHFEITNLPKRKIHYLRLTQEGAKVGLVKVKIELGKSVMGRKDLTLVIVEGM